MIKAIIFDCFGVLTVDTWRELYAHVEPDLKTKVDQITKAYDSGYVNKETLIREASIILEIDESKVREAQAPKNNKNTALLEYIRNLKALGYKIGLLSNINNNWIREQFLSKTEQGLFDEMLLSYEVQMAKPDSGIYKAILERLSVEPEESIFIDDIDSYCRAAEGIGMQAINYRNFIQTKRAIENILGSH